MCDFENNIAKLVNDDGVRLTYLKYYCRGPAREATDGYSMFSPQEGYKLALENLKQLFGNEHQVSRSLITSVKNEIRNVREHPMSWQLLIIKLRDCKLAFTQMGKLEHLNSFETLEGLLKCFSGEIRDNCIKLSGKLNFEGLVPNFDNVIQMVSEKANYFSNLYSHLASNKDRVSSVKRTPPNIR